MVSKESEFLLAFTKSLSDTGVQIINSQDIVKEDIIGRGGYGKVTKGKYNGKYVAIKELIADCKLKEAFLEISKEINFIKAAQNDKLPQMFGIVIDDTESLGLVFEFIDGAPLNILYHSMDNKTKLDVVRQLVEILVFLHSKKLIHRDIKPQNIMIEEGNNVRLIDFGVSKIAEKTATATANCLGTTSYMAPENFDVDLDNPENPRPIQISPKADVWSVGCLISELFSGAIPWGLKNNLAIERKLTCKAAYPIPKEITLDPIRKLISLCTIVEPSERPSSKELLASIEDSLKQL